MSKPIFEEVMKISEAVTLCKELGLMMVIAPTSDGIEIVIGEIDIDEKDSKENIRTKLVILEELLHDKEALDSFIRTGMGTIFIHLRGRIEIRDKKRNDE